MCHIKKQHIQGEGPEPGTNSTFGKPNGCDGGVKGKVDERRAGGRPGVQTFTSQNNILPLYPKISR